jgi:hypothetical protein
VAHHAAVVRESLLEQEIHAGTAEIPRGRSVLLTKKRKALPRLLLWSIPEVLKEPRRILDRAQKELELRELMRKKVRPLIECG